MDQRQKVFFPLRKFFYRHLVDPCCAGILSDPLPYLLQSSRFIDLHQHVSDCHRTFFVIAAHTADGRAACGLGTWTGCLRTLICIPILISLPRFGLPISISGPSSPHCVDSSVPSRPPLVHGFPSLLDAIKRVRPGGIDLPLPDHQGFLLHAVASASSALSRWDYP